MKASEDISVIKNQIKQLEEIQKQVSEINTSLRKIFLPENASIQDIEAKKQERLEEKQKQEEAKKATKEGKKEKTKAEKQENFKREKNPPPVVSAPEVKGEIVATQKPTILLDANVFIQINETLGKVKLKEVLSFLKQSGFNLVITNEIIGELDNPRYEEFQDSVTAVESPFKTAEINKIKEDNINRGLPAKKNLGELSLLKLIEKYPEKYANAIICTEDINFLQERINKGSNNPIFIQTVFFLIIATINRADLLKQLITEQKVPEELKKLHSLTDKKLIENLNKLLVKAGATINLITIMQEGALQFGRTQGSFSIISYKPYDRVR